MNLVLAAQTANETGPGVQQSVVNSAGLVVGLVSLVLVAAWWAYFYR